MIYDELYTCIKKKEDEKSIDFGGEKVQRKIQKKFGRREINRFWVEKCKGK